MCFDSEVEVEAAKGVLYCRLMLRAVQLSSEVYSDCGGEGLRCDVLYPWHSLNFHYPHRVKPLEILTSLWTQHPLPFLIWLSFTIKYYCSDLISGVMLLCWVGIGGHSSFSVRSETEAKFYSIWSETEGVVLVVSHWIKTVGFTSETKRKWSKTKWKKWSEMKRKKWNKLKKQIKNKLKEIFWSKMKGTQLRSIFALKRNENYGSETENTEAKWSAKKYRSEKKNMEAKR